MDLQEELPDPSSKALPPRISLNVLCTCDLHMWLRSYDYVEATDVERGSLSKIASELDAVRAAKSNVLLVDAGDSLQGQPVADVLAQEFKRGARAKHPMIQAMNAMGYDAAVPGNHDFDFGLAFARHALSQAAFPVLLSNIELTGAAEFASQVLLDRAFVDADGQMHDLKIGIIGVLPQQFLPPVPDLVSSGLSSRARATKVSKAVSQLQADGADLIIALAHEGVPQTGKIRTERAAVHWLAQIPGVDAIVCGHTHDLFPDPELGPSKDIDPVKGAMFGRPVVQAGHNGSHLGNLELEIVLSAEGWRVVDWRTRLQAVKSRVEAPEILGLSAPLHHQVIQDLNTVVAELGSPIHNYFAAVGRDTCSALIGQAKADYARRIAQDLGLDGLPILALTSPFRAGGRENPTFVDVGPGPLRRRHLTGMYPFQNHLSLVRLHKDQIWAIAEITARKFHQILPGEQDQSLMPDAVPCYEIETLQGLNCTIDLAALPNQRLVQIESNVGAFEPETEYLVAMSSFRASALGLVENRVHESAEPFPVLLDRFCKTNSAVAPPPNSGWTFKGIAGASVQLKTGLGARRFLSDIKMFTPEDLGVNGEGFLCIRAHLDSGTK